MQTTLSWILNRVFVLSSGPIPHKQDIKAEKGSGAIETWRGSLAESEKSPFAPLDWVSCKCLAPRTGLQYLGLSVQVPTYQPAATLS